MIIAEEANICWNCKFHYLCTSWRPQEEQCQYCLLANKIWTSTCKKHDFKMLSYCSKRVAVANKGWSWHFSRLVPCDYRGWQRLIHLRMQSSKATIRPIIWAAQFQINNTKNGGVIFYFHFKRSNRDESSKLGISSINPRLG